MAIRGTTPLLTGMIAAVLIVAGEGRVALTDQDRSVPAPPLRETGLEMLPVRGNTYMLVAGDSNVTVQIGQEGVLLVDAGPANLADRVLATIRSKTDMPIRWIVNTHLHPDHTGGNAALAKSGRAIGQNLFGTGPMFQGDTAATIAAHENVLLRMSGASGGGGEQGKADGWPGSTYFRDEEELFFNGEPVQMLWQPAAHTDGDSLVFFRRSDILSTGDVFVTTTFPVIDVATGGTINGVVTALNHILDLTIPDEKQEGGTLVIPGEGHLSDEADVVDYRDMVTIIRDRIQDLINKGMTLDQVKAAKTTLDYEGRYGATTGPWTTAQFVEAVYKTLSPAPAPAQRTTTRGGAPATPDRQRRP